MHIRFAVCLAILLSAAARAQPTPEKIPLWKDGAPGFESRKDLPEEAKDYWVKNINNPSITAYLPPKDKATGAAVVICPGGGHRELVFNAEGDEPARYLNSLGIAAFALKYRLFREPGSPYTMENAQQDGRRAMRLVRSHAKEWNIDPNRIGLMGFSAGGEMVSWVSFGRTDGDPNAADPVDRVSCRPDFIIMIYPGPLGVPDVIPAGAPPAFLAVADDDGLAGVVVNLLQKYRAAKVPVEAHMFAQGKHAFNMGNRSSFKSIRGWPERLADWLSDTHVLVPAQTAKDHPAGR